MIEHGHDSTYNSEYNRNNLRDSYIISEDDSTEEIESIIGFQKESEINEINTIPQSISLKNKFESSKKNQPEKKNTKINSIIYKTNKSSHKNKINIESNDNNPHYFNNNKNQLNQFYKKYKKGNSYYNTNKESYFKIIDEKEIVEIINKLKPPQKKKEDINNSNKDINKKETKKKDEPFNKENFNILYSFIKKNEKKINNSICKENSINIKKNKVFSLNEIKFNNKIIISKIIEGTYSKMILIRLALKKLSKKKKIKLI